MYVNNHHTLRIWRYHTQTHTHKHTFPRPSRHIIWKTSLLTRKTNDSSPTNKTITAAVVALVSRRKYCRRHPGLYICCEAWRDLVSACVVFVFLLSFRNDGDLELLDPELHSPEMLKCVWEDAITDIAVVRSVRQMYIYINECPPLMYRKTIF